MTATISAIPENSRLSGISVLKVQTYLIFSIIIASGRRQGQKGRAQHGSRAPKAAGPIAGRTSKQLNYVLSDRYFYR